MLPGMGRGLRQMQFRIVKHSGQCDFPTVLQRRDD